MNKNKIFKSLFAVLLIISLPTVILLVQQQRDIRSNASAPDKIESEGGVISGAVTKLTDSLASGGQYVKFGNSSTPPSPTTNPNNKYPPDTTLSQSFSIPNMSVPPISLL